MRQWIFVGVVAAVALVPAFALPQPTTGGSGFGCDTKGLEPDNDRRGISSTANSGVTTRNSSPDTTPQAGAPGANATTPSTKPPLTKTDCERARGTWEEMQMKCTRC
jgi:hypothetical protein